MKKWFIATLMLLLTLTFVGCGGGSKKTTTSASRPDVQPTAQPTTETQPAPQPKAPSKPYLSTDGNVVTDLYSQPGVDFKFKSSPVSGTPRTLGTSQDGTAEIELYGDSGNVSKLKLAAITITSMTDENLLYLTSFLKRMEPDWEGRTKWLSDAIDKSKTSGGEVSTTHNNEKISLHVRASVGMISLSVEPQ